MDLRKRTNALSTSEGPGDVGLSKKLIATVVVACAVLIGAMAWLFGGSDAPAPSSSQSNSQSTLTDFSHWAVVLVAGDYRAHSGAPSKVFDNARHDLVTAFANIGFSKANMVQFSVDYDQGTQHT